MPFDEVERQLLSLFAELLDYPGEELARRVAQCERQCAERYPAAARSLAAFGRFVARTDPGELEALYSRTFELNALSHPYIGYHLFGETYQRSALLVGLAQRFRAAGFDPGIELPDHLGVLLRFAAMPGNEAEAAVVFEEAILPVLKRMIHPDEAPGEFLARGLPSACGPACAGMPPMASETQLPQPTPRERTGAKAYRLVLRALHAVLEPAMAPRRAIATP